MYSNQFSVIYFYVMSLILITLGLWLILHIGLPFETLLGCVNLILGIGLAGLNTRGLYGDKNR